MLTKTVLMTMCIQNEYTLLLSVKINFNYKSYFIYKLLVLKIRFACK